jgi:MFS family permease
MITAANISPATTHRVILHTPSQQAVTWNSWTSFVSGSILSFIFAPTVGNLSDHWGRKPFILAGVLMALLPMLTLMVHLWGWIPIEWWVLEC